MISLAGSRAGCNRIRNGWLAALVLVALARPIPASAFECPAFDAAHSEVTFEILDGSLPVRGRFHRFDGEACLSGGALTRIHVRLAPGSVDTGLSFLDDLLRDEAFFAVAAHPYAEFASDRINGADEVRTVAYGTLSLKGVTRPVDVPFAIEDDAVGMTVSGTLVFERGLFHIGTGAWARANWLGPSVQVAFRFRLAPANSVLGATTSPIAE